MGLVGKKLGKVLFLEENEAPKDEPRRLKYKKWFLIQCDCGNKKWVPVAGAVKLRSCGCARFDYHKVTANETIRHFPNRIVLSNIKNGTIYEEI